jgi:hypothetical protein
MKRVFILYLSLGFIALIIVSGNKLMTMNITGMSDEETLTTHTSNDMAHTHCEKLAALSNLMDANQNNYDDDGSDGYVNLLRDYIGDTVWRIEEDNVTRERALVLYANSNLARPVLIDRPIFQAILLLVNAVKLIIRSILSLASDSSANVNTHKISSSNTSMEAEAFINSLNFNIGVNLNLNKNTVIVDAVICDLCTLSIKV